MMPHNIQLDVCTTVDYVSSVTAEHNSKEISYLIEMMCFLKSHCLFKTDNNLGGKFNCDNILTDKIHYVETVFAET